MKNHRMIFVICFFCILSSAIFLHGVYLATGKKPDVALSGYTEEQVAPEFGLDAVMSGDFQRNAESWLDANLLPKGFYIKNYSQIQYTFFRQGKAIIGNDGNIFEKGYVDEVIVTKDESLEEEKIKAHVAHLESIHRRLEKMGKHLFVYTTPTKAAHQYEDIPYSFRVLQQGGKDILPRRQIDVFREEISKTDVNYFDTNEVIYENPGIVPFYKKGIHWSRPIEQLVTAEIVNQLSDISGNSFSVIQMGQLKSRETPFGRDNDVYDLLNVYRTLTKETYYEFETEKSGNSRDRLRILVQGGSFALGLKDYFELYPEDEMSYINYDNYIIDSDGKTHLLEDDWSRLDLQYYLDNTDFVVIEMNEAAINLYSSGFVKYLDEFLE